MYIRHVHICIEPQSETLHVEASENNTCRSSIMAVTTRYMLNLESGARIIIIIVVWLYISLL